MRVRNRVVCVAVALCAVWPASALANVDSIVVAPGTFSDFLCLGATTASPVQLALTTPQGTTLQTITLPTADNLATTGCPTTSTDTFQPGAALSGGAVQPAFGRYPAGSIVTATQNGVSVAFALPYGAYADGVTLIRDLPNPAALTGGVVDPTAPGSYDGPVATTNGDPVTAIGTASDSNGTPVPLNETITPAQFRIALDGQTVTVTGGDPLSNDVGATLSAPGGGVIGRAALRTRLGSDCASGCQSSATFDGTPIGGGAISVAGQSGWFAGRNVTLPSASIRLDGFDVSVPAGDTGSYSYTLRYIDPATITSRAPFDPFRCLDLGPAVDCGTGSPINRSVVSTGGIFVAPGDTISASATDPDGDSANIAATEPGFSGTLDDGSVTLIGVPKSTFTATLSSPRTPPLAPFTGSDSEQTDSSGTYTLEDTFETHINNLATITFSGLATGPVARVFQWNLNVGIDAANVLHGNTYPGGHVAVDLDQGSHTTHLETVARFDGVFTVPLGDARTGDTVRI
ncbi:MAG TPA: hypothetical protein VGF46_05580, partial [Gaiellales bacterium]